MELRRRLVRALSTLGVVIVVATIGWHLFARGEGRWLLASSAGCAKLLESSWRYGR